MTSPKTPSQEHDLAGKLKPCPHCGASAEWRGTAIYCTECKAAMRISLPAGIFRTSEAQNRDEKFRAITAWNRRASDGALASAKAENAELRRAERDALEEAKVEALAVRLAAIWEWIREPDWAEHFGTEEVIAWMNGRPSGELWSVIHELRALKREPGQ